MTIDEMIRELSGLFKLHFADEQQASARLSLYRRDLGHLTPEQLGNAYGECMKAWDETRPPMSKDILDHVKTSWKPAGDFNMKAMCDALPALIEDIRRSWFQRRGAEMKQLIEDFRAANPGHEDAAATEVRELLLDRLKSRLHEHAQRVYRGTAAVGAFELSQRDLPYRGKPCQVDAYTIAVREGREPAKRSLGSILARGKAA